MSKVGQKGIAHIFIILLLLAGIGLGVYLVQTKTNLSPWAASEPVPGLTTAFYLEATNPIFPGKEFKVNLLVSSDIDASNVFNAQIKFPTDLLEISSIDINGSGALGVSTSLAQGNYCEIRAQCPTGYDCDSNHCVPDPAPIPTSSPGNNCPNVGDQNCPAGSIYKYTKPNYPGCIFISCSPLPTSTSNSVPGGKKICAQVITRACIDKRRPNCDDSGGKDIWCYDTECKDFPTPCDVPEGWVVEEEEKCPPKPQPTCLPGSKAILQPDPTNPSCSYYVCSGLSTTPYPNIICSSDDVCPDGFYCPKPEPCPEGSACDQPTCQPKPGRDYFITHWVDHEFDNSAGTISLTGGVPTPGIKTSPDQKLIMATIVFRAKKAGTAEISFTDESSILRDSDNINILVGKYGIELHIKDINPVRGDINDDGKVNLYDLSILLSKWGTNDSKADLNGDGIVNIFDFSIFLSSWTKL